MTDRLPGCARSLAGCSWRLPPPANTRHHKLQSRAVLDQYFGTNIQYQSSECNLSGVICGPRDCAVSYQEKRLAGMTAGARAGPALRRPERASFHRPRGAFGYPREGLGRSETHSSTRIIRSTSARSFLNSARDFLGEKDLVGLAWGPAASLSDRRRGAAGRA